MTYGVVKPGPLATFSPDQFAKVFEGLAPAFRWSRAVPCPCRLNDDTDQPDPNCTTCGSDGWRYINPSAGTDRHLTRDYLPVKAIFAQAALNPDLFQRFGEWGFGDGLLTVPGDIRVGFRDRFVATQQEMAWKELLVRAAGADVPVGKTSRTTAAQKTAMRYEPVAIQYVADDATTYWYQEDWRLTDPAGDDPVRLQWVTGRGPAVGDLYTIHYTCRPVWVVDDATFGVQHLLGPPHGIKGAHQLQSLPTTFKVRLDHLTPARGA